MSPHSGPRFSMWYGIAALIILSIRFGVSLNFVAVYFDYTARSQNCALFESELACSTARHTTCKWSKSFNRCDFGSAINCTYLNATACSTRSECSLTTTTSGSQCTFAYGLPLAQISVISAIGIVAQSLTGLVIMKLVAVSTRYCALYSAFFGLLGSLLYTVGHEYNSVETIIVGRVFDGLGSGAAISMISVYLVFLMLNSPATPKQLDLAFSFIQFWIGVGIVINLLYGVAVLPSDYTKDVNWMGRLHGYYAISWVTSFAMLIIAVVFPHRDHNDGEQAAGASSDQRAPDKVGSPEAVGGPLVSDQHHGGGGNANPFAPSDASSSVSGGTSTTDSTPQHPGEGVPDPPKSAFPSAPSSKRVEQQQKQSGGATTASLRDVHVQMSDSGRRGGENEGLKPSPAGRTLVLEGVPVVAAGNGTEAASPDAPSLLSNANDGTMVMDAHEDVVAQPTVRPSTSAAAPRTTDEGREMTTVGHFSPAPPNEPEAAHPAPSLPSESIIVVALRCALIGATMHLSGVQGIVLFGPSILASTIKGLDPLIANIIIWIFALAFSLLQPLFKHRGYKFVSIAGGGIVLLAASDLIAGIGLTAGATAEARGIVALIGCAGVVAGFNLVAANISPMGIVCFAPQQNDISAPMAQAMANAFSAVVSAVWPVAQYAIAGSLVSHPYPMDTAIGTLFLIFGSFSCVNFVLSRFHLRELHGSADE